MMATGFSTAQAADVCELSERQVRTLARSGMVRPSLREPSGRGTVAAFDAFDLVKLAALAQVAALLGGDVRGAWVGATAAALESVRHAGTLEGSILLADASGAHVVHADALAAALAGVGASLLVRLDVVAQRVHARIARQLGAPPAASAAA